MRFKKTALALVCGFGVSLSANADYISVEDANNPTEIELSDESPNDNDFIGPDGPSTTLEDGDKVDIGKKLAADETGPFNLTFDFRFKEAGFTNKFFFEDEELFSTGGKANGTQSGSVTRTFWGDSGEDLDFMFSIEDHGGNEFFVNNADNDGESNRGFFVHETDGSFLLGLDDSGANEDDNHDDMIIEITASKVPEPGTLALMGLGLAGLGVGYRRRS